MIDLASISDEKLSQTVRRIKEESKLRNWSVQIPYEGSPHCFINRNDGKTILHVFSATPPTTSYAAAHLANDKFATYRLLQSEGMLQLDTIIIKASDDPAEAHAFMEKYGKIVVKPISGGHGKGITVNLMNAAQLKRAIDDALAAKSSKGQTKVLLQQQYLHESIYDLRLTCIDYRFVGAIHRVPARVVGDGVHTIKELIANENKNQRRGKAYYAPLATIDVRLAQQYLDDRINSIPLADQEVQVLGVANYGAGGETIDVTDQIPSWLVAAAEKASRVCELPVAGVDFMVAQTLSQSSRPEDIDPVIIEINKCPFLPLHDFPTYGSNRNVMGQYLDYLASL